MKTIKIENIEYSYLINKINQEEGISIELKEIKPDKNLIFKYEASLNKIIQDIKPLGLCENIEEMINSLNDISPELGFTNYPNVVMKRENNSELVKNAANKYEEKLKHDTLYNYSNTDMYTQPGQGQ